jgi:hypothetical protein
MDLNLLIYLMLSLSGLAAGVILYPRKPRITSPNKQFTVSVEDWHSSTTLNPETPTKNAPVQENHRQNKDEKFLTIMKALVQSPKSEEHVGA